MKRKDINRLLNSSYKLHKCDDKVFKNIISRIFDILEEVDRKFLEKYPQINEHLDELSHSLSPSYKSFQAWIIDSKEYYRIDNHFLDINSTEQRKMFDFYGLFGHRFSSDPKNQDKLKEDFPDQYNKINKLIKKHQKLSKLRYNIRTKFRQYDDELLKIGLKDLKIYSPFLYSLYENNRTRH